jgi:hypothetical protein
VKDIMMFRIRDITYEEDTLNESTISTLPVYTRLGISKLGDLLHIATLVFARVFDLIVEAAT